MVWGLIFCVTFVFIAVPSDPPQIRQMSNDGEGQVLFDLTRPVEEGHGLTLVCETTGGDPLPRLSWWRGSTLVDNLMEYSDKEVRRKPFKFSRVLE